MRDGMQVAQLVGRDPEQDAVRAATGCRRHEVASAGSVQRNGEQDDR